MTREAAILHDLLRRVSLRQGAGIAMRWITRASAILALTILAWACLTMVIPVPLPLREVAIAGLGGLVLALPFLVWSLRPSSLAAARLIDHRLALADRLSTAVELLSRDGGPRGLARLQISEAVVVAQGVVPRLAAPITLPRETWIAVAATAAIVLWAYFLQGWTVPGLPAARYAAVIHREGHVLSAIGQHLEIAGRAKGLPETRRAAPGLLDAGQRLQGSRVTREDALRLLQAAGRQLQAAQSRVERRLGGSGLRGVPGSQEPRVAPNSPADPNRLQQTIRELESLTGRLRNEGSETREDLAQRLRTVSESLERMNAPASARRNVADARREVDRGQSGAAAGALGEALQDLEGLERMLGDDQALGDARRQVEKSAERIARGGPFGTGPKVENQSSSESGPPPQAPGPNAVAPTSEDAAPPPPGPNQGSLPGEGRGARLGAPTQRLGGTRVEERLVGRQGEGTAVTRDLLAPGRAGAPRLPAAPLPADVVHQNDRALARDPLPPAYLTLIRRYFESLENTR